ncbi:hypothetical protein [Flavobacterium palustre]|uniref:hypothetical protein n=1 Tax=Flavobacterium palustre TaxID=1476463 RepID=UPI0036213E0B
MILMACLGCKTKEVTVAKSFEKESAAMSRHFDSLFQLSLKMQMEWQRNQSSLVDKLSLSSLAEPDSSGNRKPFHYKHFVDGQLKEEIFLQGGEINKETSKNESKDSGKLKEDKAESGQFESDVGAKAASDKSTTDKNKKAEVKGFQFGFYVWLFAIIIALLVLRWIAKKFKLLDRFKLNLKGD